ncbi:hypothetical protein F5Y15DRAFT_428343 [Xylariaceae sp. FL0016]|nr:hypothetical protein F5Y15DRAFT_428343 [Xylariaceae sp. FL0016]
MGLSLRAGATALASVLAFAGVANSQGFYFSSNEGECDPKYNFQYLGCAATTSQPFAYSPTSWDYQGDNSKSVIFFDKGDFVNQTITPYFCAQTCRHHGFKYSALWDKGCNCANSLDHTTPGGTTVTLSTTIDANSDTKCINGQDGQPYGNCGGDLRESCGSNQGARIFVDPSFPDERDLGTPAQIAAIAQSYDLLGCFKTQNLPSSVDAVTKVQGISPSDCLNYCADLGSPLVSMTQTTTANSVNCLCGSDFGQGSQQVIVNDNSCSLSCADPTSTTPCTGQDCCGAGNGPFPIYANPKLMGCYIPVIPGVADPAADNPAPDGYDCFPTPQSILARDPSPVVSYVAKTMSASAVFKATAAPAANEYSVYGCYADTTPADLFNTPNAQTLTNVNVETCITACDNGGFAFAGVYGTTTGNNPGTTKCVCGSAGDLKTGVTPNNAMENCNQPCTGSAQENCGGNNGPLLYARAAIAADGPWHASWTVSYANTPTYSCKPTGSSAPGSSAPAPPVSSGPAASGAASSSAAESSPADGSSAAASSSPIISIPTTIPTDVPTSEPADSSSGAAGSSDAATTSGPIISIPTSISTDVSTTDQSGSPTEIGTVLPTTIISISQPESGSATPSDSSSVEPTSAPDATTGEPSEGPSSGPTDMSSEEPSGSATESPSAGPSDTVSPSGGVTSAPVSSSSGTVTMSSSASAVSNTVEPTVTLASTQIQPYGAIFDDSKVPPGTGIKANLVVYDSDGNPSTQEYVIMYVGCFEIAPGSSPFDGNKTDFVGKAQAGGSAGACSGFCAGVPMMLSADNSGDCFCGIDLAGSNVLTLAPNRDACNIPCEDDPSQTCGGGSKLQKRADSFLNIILAQPVDQAVLIPPPSSSSAGTFFLSIASLSFQVCYANVFLYSFVDARQLERGFEQCFDDANRVVRSSNWFF